ncbi:glycoside hydrolase family 125 protein [Flavobacterium cupreum]|uniref:Glycoside hydrolase family 125 protein n=2 Tax=Flavobacterium TaxID=237 RepID=A0A4Y7UDW9_9FLAO|nr:MULTISPECIES: glycoside hydrolase family 125 protein [Flavobacterium]RUT67974.1 glycoside hydrolase family 125 protein [Flavobacterium cupreum]TCN58999.1 hypothetical protein EV142_103448 [Flavobacterium circumlabens]TEB44401.1 glycoside hydrolase family 125 protein [Flavobacterium circumlabens]
MYKRRDFIKGTVIAGLGITLLPEMVFAKMPVFDYKSLRPALADRRFISKAVEKEIVEVSKKIKDKELAWLFSNCFPNTLDTTVFTTVKDNKPDTYIITGDIDAMWLRDSSAQVWPYLPLMKNDTELEKMIAGVINRHAYYVLIDPYANAFFNDNERKGHNDETLMKPGVHERKWEVDSLCYVIRLAYGYWKQNADKSCFDSTWLKAMKEIVATFKNQQRKSNNGSYNFKRVTNRPTDTAAGGGAGAPVNPIGLIASVFRPSDDGTVFPFLIPSNYFAVVSLRQLAEIVEKQFQDETFSSECLQLANEVENALKEYAVINHKKAGEILAYEIDGFGGCYLIDDSNIPSLLSLPYLGAINVNTPLYKNTRKFLLTPGNHPYYAEGKVAKGITGPHVGRDMIWPMSIIMRGITSNDEMEIKECIEMLKKSHGGTGFMHEAFYKDDATKFTRKWFAWANTLFGEFIIKLADERPHLLS